MKRRVYGQAASALSMPRLGELIIILLEKQVAKSRMVQPENPSDFTVLFPASPSISMG